MTHDHHHHHHSHLAPAAPNPAFRIAMLLNLGIVAFEAVYGILTHSVSLLADAGHNLTDVLALGLAWFAAVLATRTPTRTRTYGFRRTTILASLLNAVLLILATGAIMVEAFRKLLYPTPSEGLTMAWVAGVAIVLNGVSAWLFAADREHDLNIKATFIHMLSDMAVSAGVVVAGLIIYWTGAAWVDPLVSIIIASVILASSWSLLRDSFNLAADAVPENIDMDAIESCLLELPNVHEVHDLHVWAMSTTDVALTAHLVLRAEDATVVNQATERLHGFGINHPTIQTELENGPGCQLAPAHVI